MREIPDIYLWPLKTVMERVGLGKSEIYRRMKDTDSALNPFPQSHRRPTGRGVFWDSREIRAWQLRELGDVPPDDIGEILG